MVRLAFVYLTCIVGIHAKGFDESTFDKHTKDWSQTCTLADQETCNSYQRGFIGFERNDDLKKATEELHHFEREVNGTASNAGVVPDDQKFMYEWKVSIMKEMIADLKRKSEL